MDDRKCEDGGHGEGGKGFNGLGERFIRMHLGWKEYAMPFFKMNNEMLGVKVFMKKELEDIVRGLENCSPPEVSELDDNASKQQTSNWGSISTLSMLCINVYDLRIGSTVKNCFWHI